MLTIDGSQGEGGGHVVRTALALSLVTGKPFVIEKIRGNRTTPGLQRAHLAAVEAASAISHGRVEGAFLESQRLMFTPGNLVPGKHRFSVGAGSTSLLAQTLLPALIKTNVPSELVVDGGTLVPNAPPYDFFAESYLSIWRKLGAKVKSDVWRHGFAPEAGGAMRVTITPGGTLAPIQILERGRLLARRALVRLSLVPARIGERELAVLEARLRWGKNAYSIDQVEANCAGNILVALMRHENVTHVDSQLHDPETAAELTGHTLNNRLDLYLASTAPVGPWLADQILVPMAVAGGGSFRLIDMTKHTSTTIEVVQKFMPELTIDARDAGDRTWTVSFRRT